MTTRPKLPPIRERDILKACLATLRERWGVLAWRENTGAVKTGDRFVRFGQPGRSDISGALPDGRRLEIEIKRPGKRPTPIQLAWLRAINQTKAVGIWVNDAAQLDAVMPRLLAGARAEIGEDGMPYVVD